MNSKAKLNPLKFNSKQIEEIAKIQKGYEKRIANQVASINRLLDERRELINARSRDEKCDHPYVTSDHFSDGQCDWCGAEVEMIWATKTFLAKGEEEKEDEVPNEKLPNETAEGDELKVTGPDGEEATPNADEHTPATNVIDEDDDVDLSDDQRPTADLNPEDDSKD